MSVCVDIPMNTCAEAVRALSAYSKSSVIIAVGEMTIEYVGRASSYASQAYRLLIIKPDGTLLVHESTKVEPLNWQPPKSVARFECIENRLRVRSIRENPREEVIIEFSSTDFAKACRLVSTKLSVVGREEDLVRLIVSNPSIVDSGSYVVGRDISTPYGKVDILLKKGDKLIVVEVKNEKAGVQSVVQLKRYVEYFLLQGHRVDGVLVAPDISQEALSMINREGLRYLDLNKVKRDIGLSRTLEKFIKMDRE